MRASPGVRKFGLWALVAGALGGCAEWSAPGTGGTAEQRQPGQSQCGACSGLPAPTAEALDAQFQLVRSDLDRLVLRGAASCLPAHVADARDRQARIARELREGLSLDARDDLVIQRDRLIGLERRLDSMRVKGTCVVPAVAGLPPVRGGR